MWSGIITIAAFTAVYFSGKPYASIISYLGMNSYLLTVWSICLFGLLISVLINNKNKIAIWLCYFIAGALPYMATAELLRINISGRTPVLGSSLITCCIIFAVPILTMFLNLWFSDRQDLSSGAINAASAAAIWTVIWNVRISAMSDMPVYDLFVKEAFVISAMLQFVLLIFIYCVIKRTARIEQD